MIGFGGGTSKGYCFIIGTVDNAVGKMYNGDARLARQWCWLNFLMRILN